MPVSTEMLTGLIAIAATILGAWAYIAKRKVDIAYANAESDKREAEARAQKMETEAQTRLKEIEADIEMRKALAEHARHQSETADKQLQINEQLQSRMDAQRTSAEEGYKIIRGVQDDMNRQLTNMYNAIRELKEATLTSRNDTMRRLDDLPGKMHIAGMSMMGEFVKTLAAETAISIAEQFERQRLETTLYPFPDPDDPDWREEMVYAIAEDVTIRKEPMFWDNALLQKPCAKINPVGEKMLIITGRTKDWVIVDKTPFGERCWGWVKARDVRIGEAEPLPA